MAVEQPAKTQRPSAWRALVAHWLRGDHDRRDRWRNVAVGVVLGLVGAWIGITLAGPTTSQVGPLTVTTQITPAWHGHTQLNLPPLGNVSLPTHRTPVLVDATVTGVNLTQATQTLSELSQPQTQHTLVNQARAAATRTAVKEGVAALLGAVVVALLLARRRTSVLVAAGVTVVVLAVLGVTTTAWFNPRAVSQPTYTGELTNAPKVVAGLSNIENNLGTYGNELAGLVANAVNLLHVSEQAGSQADITAGTVRVLHVSDIHLAIQAWPLIREVVDSYHINFVIDTGDLSDHGTAVENETLAPIATLGVPYVYVRGNHDSPTTVRYVKSLPNAIVLNDSSTTIHGITVAGAADTAFTPDKTSLSQQAKTQRDALRLRAWLRHHPGVEIAAYHDPTALPILDGAAPTELYGHIHAQYTFLTRDGTRVFIQGSTGGAGLRALQGEQPTPVTLTVLYIDPISGSVKAFDDITLGGFGQTQAQVTRIIVNSDGTTPIDKAPSNLQDLVAPAPAQTGQPSPSGQR